MPDPPRQTEPLGSSPLKKEVSFNPLLTVPASASSTSTSTTSTSPSAVPKQRRSSIKQGTTMPSIPARETFQHPDALLRRLRLRDSWGKPANLQAEFRDAQVVAFFFGSACCLSSVP